MRKIIPINIIIFLFVFISGCAYYNTFFNAKKYFNEAEKERKKRLEQEEKRYKTQGKDQKRNPNRISSGEMKKYNESIKKASKVLELYPNSKYVDDALFLLGKCFFRKLEYQKAQRKFLELMQNFPDSKFVLEARLWLAKTYIELKNYDIAEKTLQELINSNVKSKITDEARFLLGGLFKHKNDYIRAISEYETAAKRAKDKAIRAQAYYELGESYYQMKNYEKAIESFKKAKKYSPDEKFDFKTMFQAGLTYEKIEKYDEAIKIFTRLLGDVANEENWPACRLEIAHCYRLGRDFEEAKAWYQDLIERHPKTIEASDAYYYLGKIYLDVEGEYEFAKENFDKAPTENPRGPKANEARAMSKSIQRLLALREDIVQQQKRIAAGDSVAAAIEDSLDVGQFTEKYSIQYIDSMFADTSHFNMDSLGIFNDTLRIQLQDSIRIAFQNEENINLRRRVLDQIEEAQRRSKFRDEYEYQQELKRQLEEQKKKSKMAIKSGELGTPLEELVKDKLLLAEIYLFEFSQPDSALSEYLDILEIDTSKKVIPKVLYSIGYIAENFKQDTVLADSMFQRLITEYPDDIFAKAARNQVKTIDVPDPEREAAKKFEEAEKAYYENRNYEYALNTFNMIQEEFPSSDFAPKSLLAMGWIYENDLLKLNEAFDTYQTLLDRYPSSVYAKQVQKKVAAVKKAKSSEDKVQQEEQPQQVQPAQTEETVEKTTDQTEDVDIASMSKEEYRRYLLMEMQKNDPRRKTPRRW